MSMGREVLQPKRALGKPEPRSVSRGQAAAVLATGLFVVGAIAAPYTDPWREARYRHLSPDALEHERVAHPTDPVLLFWLGQRLNEQARYGEAVPVLQTAAQADPTDARIRDAWAQSLLGTGRSTQALAQLKQFAASRPGDAHPFLLLGKLHATLGADAPAQEALEQATRLDANSAEAWALLGDVYYRRAREFEAEAALCRAIALSPTFAAAHLSLARVLSDNNPREAGEEFRRASELAPHHALARRERAEFLYTQGNLKAAEAEAQACLQINANDGRAHLVLGRCLVDRQAFTEARAPLESATMLAPFDPVPAQYLQRLYARTGNVKAAKAWAKRLAQNHAVAAEGRRLRDALLTHPADTTLNRRMARYQAKLGKVEDCVHHLAIALQTTLDAPATLQTAASDLRQAGHESAAQALEARIANTAQ